MSTTILDIMQNLKQRHRLAQSTLALSSTSTSTPTSSTATFRLLQSVGLFIVLVVVVVIIVVDVTGQPANVFPGVSREVAPFCSSRPSLSIDLAPMIVHVKRNTSFNYKLYLISSNEFVFQTGQIVPRDHFKIHSFPVKLKSLQEFLGFQADEPQLHLKTFRYENSSSNSLVQVANSAFDWKNFLRLVPLLHEQEHPQPKVRRKQRQSTPPLIDLHADVLPGDETAGQQVSPVTGNLNELIQFDRDDQLEPLDSRKHRQLGEPNQDKQHTSTTTQEKLILPVGSFSSFHVNLTYLVRKDFDQVDPQLVKLFVDAAKFQVNEVHVISNGTQASYPSHEDYNFLGHKLLRDANTRITSISQIYEDWITRNFYTIVYIQRRLEEVPEAEEAKKQVAATSVTDRLIFRGSSPVLLGAEQLDYDVKASAFITEKNGLHYYLEFLANGKFYVGAIDWTKRPFKIIDSRKFPMKQTKTMFDNEELLLCPPALCYSVQPIDELVGYGRLALQEDYAVGHHHNQLRGTFRQVSSASNRPTIFASSTSGSRPDDEDLQIGSSSSSSAAAAREPRAAVSGNGTADVEALIKSMRLGSASLEVRLHLRDWTWTLTRSHYDKSKAGDGDDLDDNKDDNSDEQTSRPAFLYRFEWAKRNEVKVNPDSYGFVLAGHQIDASYRVSNELYLISANHLITINYTLSNETVTSSQLIGDEFAGLSSTLSDPITGALYERNSNQVYFFKGDRYVGYDFATKRPLEDFQLAPPGQPVDEASRPPPLVSSLPVIGMLGRQHQVDGVYHDLWTDVVYIFSGMKFYTYPASQFKNGAFRAAKQPAWQCINEHFLDGCHFDEAYPNPCKLDELHSSDRQSPSKLTKSARLSLKGEANSTDSQLQGDNNINNNNKHNHLTNDFSQEQQLKLMSIAARGSLLDFLSQGPLRQTRLLLADSPAAATSGRPSNGSSSWPSSSSSSSAALASSQERIVVYLLMAMVAITIVVTAAMIVVLLNWTKWRQQSSRGGSPPSDLHPSQGDLIPAMGPAEFGAPFSGHQQPPLLLGHNNYLANQHHFMRRQQQQQHHQNQQPVHQGYLVGQRQLVGDSLAGPAPPLPTGKPPKFLSTPTNKSTSTSRRSKSRDKIDSSAL